MPRPGATQPTLPVRSPAESPRPAAAVPKLRANKVPAHYMRLCVLMQVRLTQLLQVKQGALAGIKKKKSQTGKNRDRCVRVWREHASVIRNLQARQEACGCFEKKTEGLQEINSHYNISEFVFNLVFTGQAVASRMWLWHAATLEVCGVEEKVRVYISRCETRVCPPWLRTWLEWLKVQQHITQFCLNHKWPHSHAHANATTKT